MKTTNTRLLLICSLLVVATAFLRVLNLEMGLFHLTPLAAISLFTGAVIKDKSYAYMLPLGALLISDIFLEVTSGTGFYGMSQLFVYIGMMSVAFLGTKMRSFKPLSIAGFSIAGSTLFWIISNLGVFLGGYYGFSFTGFIQTYVMAIPFLGNEMSNTLFINAFASDLFMSFVLFGTYAFVRKSQLSVAKAS